MTQKHSINVVVEKYFESVSRVLCLLTLRFVKPESQELDASSSAKISK
jgi:hypothetical protein